MPYATKEDQKAAQRAYYLRNRDAIKAKAKAWREAHPERAAEAVRQWHRDNRDGVKATKAAYYRKNAEGIKAKARAHHHATYVHHPRPEPLPRKDYLANWREKHRPALRQESRARYRKNAAEICAYLKDRRERNRDEWLAWSREYRQKNQHKRNASSAARRAAKLNVPVGERSKVEAFYRWVRTAPLVLCHHCGKPVPKNKRHVDHLLALKAGGSHTLDNLVPSCERCNCRKGARPVEALHALILATSSPAPGGRPCGSSRLPPSAAAPAPS